MTFGREGGVIVDIVELVASLPSNRFDNRAINIETPVSSRSATGSVLREHHVIDVESVAGSAGLIG